MKQNVHHVHQGCLVMCEPRDMHRWTWVKFHILVVNNFGVRLALKISEKTATSHP